MTEEQELEIKPLHGSSNIHTFQERGCSGCDAKSEHIHALKEALTEVVEENEALRTRVVELEAWVNKAGDKLDKRQNQIEELYSHIAIFKDN